MFPIVNPRATKVRTLGALLLLATLAAPAAWAEQDSPPDLVLVLDASGSMWGQIDGEAKIVIARQVLGDLLDQLAAPQHVGVVAYGHRREGDCADIELVAPVAPLDRQALQNTVAGLNPRGKTPITAAIERAFEVVGDDGATVIVITDGLETCGGDPCAAVRAARHAGRDFVMHVIGFDVADDDVSQLECAAQAGGGRYLEAADAAQLATALDQASELSAEVPTGSLAVKATADGALHDVAILVTDTNGQQVATGRTYASADTNPRVLTLADGAYVASIQAIGIDGDNQRQLRFEIVNGSTVSDEVDFSTGELAIGVTRNGELSDAVYRVVVASTGESAAQGRTYTRATSNPAILRLTSGRYRAGVQTVEMSDEPEHSFGDVEVTAGQRTVLGHGFTSGVLRVGVERAGHLADAVVRIYADSQVAQARTYTSATSNPKSFNLSPGSYRVVIKAIGGKVSSEHSVEVAAEETVDLTIEVE